MWELQLFIYIHILEIETTSHGMSKEGNLEKMQNNGDVVIFI